MRKEALQTFLNIYATNKRLPKDVLKVLRRENFKLKPRATAKHKWHKLAFAPNTKSPSEFLEELNEYAERACGDRALQMIDSFLYAKMQPHLKRSINLAYLENGTCDQIVTHLEREIEHISIENDEELPILTVTVTATRENASKLDLSQKSCLIFKKLDQLIQACRKNIRKEQERKRDPTQNVKRSKSKTFPLLHAVKEQTIHPRNFGTVPMQPTDKKTLNEIHLLVTIKGASKKVHLHKKHLHQNLKITKARCNHNKTLHHIRPRH